MVAVLLLRRLPAVLALNPLMRGMTGGECPVPGLVRADRRGGFYYANLSLREMGIEAAWTVGSPVICASILAHGFIAATLTKLYGRRTREDRRR